MLTRLRHILEMIRFSHTLFALPFALLAALMAWSASADLSTSPGRWRLAREALGVLLCMVFARSAAMSFNRLADREIDARNPRTAGRHLPAGSLSVATVVVFTAGCCVGFVAATLLFLPNRWPLLLSLPLLAFVFGYSYAKRFTSLAHFWLGAALMLAPLATWLALRGELDWPPLLLGAAVFFWVAGFDIIYACQDYEFDRASGLRSVPAYFGVSGALRIAAACHVLTVAALAALPLCYDGFGGLFWGGTALVAALLVYEHALVSSRDLSRVNAAFFNVNVVISLGLLAVGTLDLLV